MLIEKIEYRTIRERVYDVLKRNIIHGELPPGQTISLREIAEQFGVSIIPVREALWQLESEDIIVIESNKSIHVNKMTPRELEEALWIRTVMESHAAELSCEKRPEEAVGEVKKLLDEAREAVDDPKTYMLKNNEFHFKIYSYADSPMLFHIIDWVWARIGPYFFIYATKSGSSKQTITYHNEIYQAFAKKDAKALIEAIKKDIDHSSNAIMPLIREEQEARTS
jgi:DNA-binding GntR family transcriptional regulator